MIFAYTDAELDVGDAWELESEDGMSLYGDDPEIGEIVTINVDKRKSSTGSQVSLSR